MSGKSCLVNRGGGRAEEGILHVLAILFFIIFEGEHLTEFYTASLLSSSRVLLGALFRYCLCLIYSQSNSGTNAIQTP